jgi:hypothetical protein
MEWRKGRRSDNVVDARAKVAVAAACVSAAARAWARRDPADRRHRLAHRQDPLQILGQLAGQMEQQQQQTAPWSGQGATGQ